MKSLRGLDYTQADRVILMVARLATHGQLDVHRLAEEFGVSTRTIYRDLSKINRHIPILRDSYISERPRYILAKK